MITVDSLEKRLSEILREAGRTTFSESMTILVILGELSDSLNEGTEHPWMANIGTRWVTILKRFGKDTKIEGV